MQDHFMSAMESKMAAQDLDEEIRQTFMTFDTHCKSYALWGLSSFQLRLLKQLTWSENMMYIAHDSYHVNYCMLTSNQIILKAVDTYTIGNYSI